MDDVKLYNHSKHEIESLIYTVNVFFEDICMGIGTSKCNAVSISKGKVIDSENVPFVNFYQLECNIWVSWSVTLYADVGPQAKIPSNHFLSSRHCDL